MPFKFKVIAKSKRTAARAGTLVTGRGVIPTPVFMPVGTQATVKGLHQRELEKDLDAPIILANTYHLYLRPGIKLLKKAGGIHAFMGWQRPILTDSGGFQVYSLANRRKIEEKGVRFSSHIDGSLHMLTPENTVDIQRAIGADIIMAFDECTPYPCSYDYARQSMERTHRWLDRCLEQFKLTSPLYGHEQVLFPIVQGGIYEDLRKISAAYIAERAKNGCAIGGVCHPTGKLYEVVTGVTQYLPPDQPRYLMGVGTPEDLLACISSGVDMFDCVLPARNGRNGSLFTTQGVVNIRNKKWRDCFEAIDEGLDHYASNHYTLAYLHHLMRSGERLGGQIAAAHNLAFYLWLIRTAREKIINGDFSQWKSMILQQIKKKRT